MKVRKIKKLNGMECSHNKSYRFMVTDDPFPTYVEKFVCSLKKIGIYNLSPWDEESPCIKCKHFAVSKKEIRWNHEFLKEQEREYKLEKKGKKQ